MNRVETSQGSTTMATSVGSSCSEDFGGRFDANSTPSPASDLSQQQLKEAEMMDLGSPPRNTSRHTALDQKMAGSSEQYSVLGDDKRQEEEQDPINRMMKYACRPPSTPLISKEAKFAATARSNSFGGEKHQFMVAVGAMRQEQGTLTTANLSLHSLITRARRGGRRKPPYSANTSPIDADTISIRGGRPLVKLDVRNHEDLTKVIADLAEHQGTRPTSQVWTQTADQRSQDNTRTPLQRLKRHSSPAVGIQSSIPVTPQRPLQGQNKRSRRLLGDDGSIVSAHSLSCSPSPDKRPILRLPDPSTISNCRDLFAMSRKMCSLSSIEHEAHTLESHAAFRDLTNGVISRDATEHEESEYLRETDSSTAEDLDEQSFASTASLPSLQSPPATPRSPVPEGLHDKHDEESIAFSMDSVHVRKKQIDSPLYTRFIRSTGEQAFRTDWAVDSLHATAPSSLEAGGDEANDRRLRHHHRSRSSQQIVVCEFDFDALPLGSLPHLRVQSRPRRSDHDQHEEAEDDDERSFISVSSLGTHLSGRILHLE